MECQLYINHSETNRLIKDIESVGKTEIQFLESVDVFNLRIRLKNDTIANYAFINGKYYFISSKRIERKDLFELYLKEDVLMTYKDDIKSAICEVVECEDNFDESNAKYEEKEEYVTDITEIENPFQGDSIVLVTAQ